MSGTFKILTDIVAEEAAETAKLRRKEAEAAKRKDFREHWRFQLNAGEPDLKDWTVLHTNHPGGVVVCTSGFKGWACADSPTAGWHFAVLCLDPGPMPLVGVQVGHLRVDVIDGCVQWSARRDPVLLRVREYQRLRWNIDDPLDFRARAEFPEFARKSREDWGHETVIQEAVRLHGGEFNRGARAIPAMASFFASIFCISEEQEATTLREWRVWTPWGPFYHANRRRGGPLVDRMGSSIGAVNLLNLPAYQCGAGCGFTSCSSLHAALSVLFPDYAHCSARVSDEYTRHPERYHPNYPVHKHCRVTCLVQPDDNTLGALK